MSNNKPLETVSFGQLIHEWVEINKSSPSYRFGQHFINRCMDSDEGFDELWNAGDKESGAMVRKVLDEYNWPYNAIPVVRET